MPPQIIPIISNRMQSRNHPFNQSQRPLLERRQFAQPQVVKSLSSSTSSSATSSTTAATRGFNDFNLVRQYENLNHNNIGGRGYPYGDIDVNVSVSDFIFSDNNVNYNSDDDDYEDVRVYHKNQINNHRNLYTPPPPPPPLKRVLPRPVSPINVKDDGPFVFGVHTQNTFTPAYDNKTANFYRTNDTTDNKNNAASPNSSQNQSDISSSSRSSEKERWALLRRSCKKKRTKTKKDKTIIEENRKANKKKNEPPNVKCVVVGDGAVGKTNLIISYIQDRFVPDYIPTAFDKYNVEVNVDDRPICVTLCDTAGQDVLDPLRQLCYPKSDVFLLCFSVVKPETFRSVATKWAPEISQFKASVILVGTQSDLRNDIQTLMNLKTRGEKPVAVSEAWDFARSIGANYIESSSCSKERIKEVFDTAIWDALQARQEIKRTLWRKLLCLA